MEWKQITKDNIETIKELYNNEFPIMIGISYKDYNIVTYYKLNNHLFRDIRYFITTNYVKYYYIVLPKLY